MPESLDDIVGGGKKTYACPHHYSDAVLAIQDSFMLPDTNPWALLLSGALCLAVLKGHWSLQQLESQGMLGFAGNAETRSPNIPCALSQPPATV